MEFTHWTGNENEDRNADERKGLFASWKTLPTKQGIINKVYQNSDEGARRVPNQKCGQEGQ